MESQTCWGLRLSLTSPSMVALVMKLSRSVMMSMQMEQVSSFLLLGTAREEATRAERRKKATFIILLVLFSSELFCNK